MNVIEKANKLAEGENSNIKVFEFLIQGTDLVCYIFMDIYDVLQDRTMQELVNLKYFNLYIDENAENRHFSEVLEQEIIPVYFLNCWMCDCEEEYMKHAASISCNVCGKWADSDNTEILELIDACKNIIENKKNNALVFKGD